MIGECFQHVHHCGGRRTALLLIDKHAAHERILFNKLRAETDMPQQQLLTPVVVELTGEEAAAVQSQLEDIRQGRILLSTAFGENSFAVRSVPAYLDSGDVQSVISELAEKGDEQPHHRAGPSGRPHSYGSMQSSDQGRQSNNDDWSCKVCVTVCFADDNVRSCPHGRPTTVRLTKYELDKMFKRVNQ